MRESERMLKVKVRWRCVSGWGVLWELKPPTLHWNFFIRLVTLQNKAPHLITRVLLLHCGFAESALVQLRVHDSVFRSELYMKNVCV